MELLLLLFILLVGALVLKSREQRVRIALLAEHLSQFQVEKLMETLTEGYLRALGEDDPERRTQVWNVLSVSEQTVASQFTRFAASFSRVDAQQARVSKLNLAIPYTAQLFPGATFDVRQVFTAQALGLASVVQNEAGLSPRDKAYMLSAELFLIQHTCHWFCRSRLVANARLHVRHKTSFAQVLASVSPQTRRAYCQAVGIQPPA